jgi:para-aminobenzoate synthetase component 1
VAAPRRLESAPSPLEAFAAASGRPGVAFLDAAANPPQLGRWSYLATDPVETLTGSAADWPEAATRLRAGFNPPQRESSDELPPFRGGWIGWFSYEFGRAFDAQPVAPAGVQQIPDFSLASYDSLLAWDHQTGTCWQVGEPAMDGSRELATTSNRGEPVANFTREQYIAAVATVIERILAGDIFQANLSQRFVQPFTGDTIALYHALRRRAGGSHSAYIERGGITVLSLSPERFFSYDPVRRLAETRPIKGTRPRDHDDPARDAALADELRRSEKDRAENVMIVDLMRNDLHRVSLPDSVVVPSLCDLESHAAVHHLVSTVQGTLAPGRDVLDLLAATFPGGSITGAPKLRAMEIIAELEAVARGIYCGAIGWIGNDGGADLNIAIRTVTVADGVATLGAGGGITALSDPGQEYQETLDKAAALLAALAEAS